MEKIKEFIKLIFVLLLVLGVSGCMLESKNPEELKDKVLEYLNKNYQDDFKPKAYSNSSWAYKYKTITFYSEKYKDYFSVRIYDKDGSYYFSDDYFHLYMKEDAKEYVQSLVAKYGIETEVKIDFNSPQRPEGLNINARFIDYVNSGECDLEVYLISNTRYSDEVKNKILKEFSNNKIMGNFRFLVTDDTDLLSQYSIDDLMNNPSNAKKILEKQSFTISNDLSIK